jgi:hypothetical protein
MNVKAHHYSGKENNMPRKTSVLTVQAWSKLTVGRLYRGQVKDIRVNRTHASHHLQVTIENLDEYEQRGRIHELHLTLPVRPGNGTCLFFLACGTDASAVGMNIRIDQTIGAVIGMRFRGMGADDSETFDFEPVATTLPAVARGPSIERSAEKTHANERDFDGGRDDSQ